MPLLYKAHFPFIYYDLDIPTETLKPHQASSTSSIRMVKPITLYGHGAGPNPYKVAIVLEELGLPYETKLEGPNTLKVEPYVKINPNGRVPAIEDPNTGITLWESGAIVEYLVNEYDKDEKLHYKTKPEKYHTQQYLHYQMSGQGPYYGQYG